MRTRVTHVGWLAGRPHQQEGDHRDLGRGQLILLVAHTDAHVGQQACQQADQGGQPTGSTVGWGFLQAGRQVAVGVEDAQHLEVIWLLKVED